MFIIFSLLVSCSTQKDRDYKKLNHYLKENFNIEDNGAEKVFIFFPSNQCRSCYKDLTYNVPKEKQKSIYIITSYPKSFFKAFDNVLLDSDNKMFDLEFTDYSITAVTIKDHKIVKIKSHINFQQECDSIINSL